VRHENEFDVMFSKSTRTYYVVVVVSSKSTKTYHVVVVVFLKSTRKYHAWIYKTKINC
jgi:hypothetical protein